MSKREDILVIGGGVIGVCSAYYLAEQGRQVTLVEQGNIAAGSSYGNAGLIVPSHCIPLAAPGVLAQGLKWMLDGDSPFYLKPRFERDLFRWLWRFRAACRDGPMRRAIPLLRDLGRASIALFEELAELKGLDFGFRKNGLLHLYRSEQGHKEGLEEVHLLQEAGIAVEVLTAAELHKRVPNVRPGVAGGIYLPNDGHLHPAEFVRGLARLVEQKGAGIRTETEVLGFEVAGRRIASARTTRGDYQPEQVILATGSWSPGLARDLRLNLPVQPAKGYSITVERPPACPTVPLILSEARVAVTPMGPILRFAGTLELAGLDFSINWRRVEAIQRAVRRYLVGMERLETVEIWRGLRPTTPDGLPIIGRPDSFENLIIATGHATLGMTLGPITGRLVSQLACHETPDIDLTAVSIERFL